MHSQWKDCVCCRNGWEEGGLTVTAQSCNVQREDHDARAHIVYPGNFSPPPPHLSEIGHISHYLSTVRLVLSTERETACPSDSLTKKGINEPSCPNAKFSIPRFFVLVVNWSRQFWDLDSHLFNSNCANSRKFGTLQF